MARRIKFRAQCHYCKEWFEKGMAYLHRIAGRWECHCDKCYEINKKKKEQKNENRN